MSHFFGTSVTKLDARYHAQQHMDEDKIWKLKRKENKGTYQRFSNHETHISTRCSRMNKIQRLELEKL